MRSTVGSLYYALPWPSTIILLAGRRTMLIVTTGGWESHYRPRGTNGPIDEIPFPIQHGFLYYLTFGVVPPFTSCHTGHMDEARFTRTMQVLAERLGTLFITASIPFRRQNVGGCDIPTLVL